MMSKSRPTLSIIIAVYNDWISLSDCLCSLAKQSGGPTFEVIVVDDGSYREAPESISKWSAIYPLRIVRQSHCGIPSARNRGIRASSGQVLVFVDADCRLQTSCLAALATTMEQHPASNCFQLRLRGDGSSLIGRAEELRLVALQDHMIQPDGRIRYLNTAGFAIRREAVNIERGLFNRAALRAEDTLLLMELMNRGELPFFAGDAVVEHAIPLTLMQCLRKDIRTAFLEGRVFGMMAAQGFSPRIKHRDRVRMLWWMWKLSGERSIGRMAWLVVTARQALQRIISFACGWLHSPSCPNESIAREV